MISDFFNLVFLGFLFFLASCAIEDPATINVVAKVEQVEITDTREITVHITAKNKAEYCKARDVNVKIQTTFSHEDGDEVVLETSKNIGTVKERRKKRDTIVVDSHRDVTSQPHTTKVISVGWEKKGSGSIGQFSFTSVVQGCR